MENALPTPPSFSSWSEAQWIDSLSELARLAKPATAGGSRWVGGSEVWNMDVKHERIRSAPPSSPIRLTCAMIPSHPIRAAFKDVVNCLRSVRLSPELSP